MKNQTLFVMLSIISTLLLNTSVSSAKELSSAEAEKKITRLIKLTEKETVGAFEFNQLVDIKSPSEKLVQQFDVTSEAEKTRLSGAIRSYLANAILSIARAPRLSRNKELDTIWARTFLGKGKAKEMMNSPVTFAIRDIKNSSSSGQGIAHVTLQLMPEFTHENDTKNQVTFVFANQAEDYKLIDLQAGGVQFLAVLSEQVTGHGDNPQGLIDALLKKHLITNEQIEEYSKL